MDSQQFKVLLGSLLHRVGILSMNHPADQRGEKGLTFLKDAGIKDSEILELITCQKPELTSPASDSLAHVVCFADDVAAYPHNKVRTKHPKGGELKPLETIFNYLNLKSGEKRTKQYYKPGRLAYDNEINYPSESMASHDRAFYKRAKEAIGKVVSSIDKKNADNLNALLKVMEIELSFVPYRLSNTESTDISLYDHAKQTASIANGVYHFYEENGITDYTPLTNNREDCYNEKMFLLFGIDMSGIQDYVYLQHTTKDVLKNLRSRSFYLEILMENMVDDLLDTLGFCRASVLYSGGGVAYLLLPNTEKVKKTLDAFSESHVNWFAKMFRTDLYATFGRTECSPADLMNKEDGLYREMFKRISASLSEKKLNRYSAENILSINRVENSHNLSINRVENSHNKECYVCHRPDLLSEAKRKDYARDDEEPDKTIYVCELCEGMSKMSTPILEEDVFSVVEAIVDKKNDKYLPLFDNRFLIPGDAGERAVRLYYKNRSGNSQSFGSMIWVGEYRREGAYTLGDLAEKGEGIKRLGVLRADIDNLGQSFVRGFLHDSEDNDANKQAYQTLARSSSFSRKVLLFFKLHINDILRNGHYTLESGYQAEPIERNCTIIYSGGDDMFVVGAWKDVIEFSVDLRDALEKFSLGSLTVSGGIGIYNAKYPIAYMAEKTGELESAAKHYMGDNQKSNDEPKKNAICLFDKSQAYRWPDFVDNVIEDKYRLIHEFFKQSQEDLTDKSQIKGKSFLYHLLELLRADESEKINLARLAYLLARMEPKKQRGEDMNDFERRREDYRVFAQRVYAWKKNEKDRRAAITAINIYAYTIRDRKE